MPAISANIKRIRAEKGLTQDAVAQELGVTRQTISSYESGRTQPDIQTLQRLAEIYEVSLEDLLYGTHRVLRQRQRLKVTALLFLILVPLSHLLPALTRWVGSRFFPPPLGQISAGTQAYERMQVHFALSRAAEGLDALSILVTHVLCLLLLIFSLCQDSPPPRRTTLRFLALASLAILLPPLPWACMDPVFSPVDYYLVPILSSLKSLLLTAALSWAIRRLRDRRPRPENGLRQTTPGDQS